MTAKRSKLFYKAVAAIRLKKAEHLLPTMLKRKFKTGYVRAARLWDELVTHGVVEDFSSPLDHVPKILRENVKRIHVPKVITQEMTAKQQETKRSARPS